MYISLNDLLKMLSVLKTSPLFEICNMYVPLSLKNAIIQIIDYSNVPVDLNNWSSTALAKTLSIKVNKGRELTFY